MGATVAWVLQDPGIAPTMSRVQMKQAARQGRANLVPSPSTQERAHRSHRPGCFSNPPGACTNSWEGAAPGHRVYYRQSGPPQVHIPLGTPFQLQDTPQFTFPPLVHCSLDTRATIHSPT